MKELEFDGMINARDISYGNIKEGRLIRGEALTNLSEADVQKLQDMNLKAIIDLRTSAEAQQPDAEIPGATYYHLPILNEKKLGVTHEEGNTEEIGSEAMAKHGFPDMCDTYRQFVTPEAKESWTKIFDLFADTEEGSIIWHCTVGKDRCGLVSAMIEYCLGLTDEEIMADYMLTNNHAVVPAQMAAVEQQLPESQRQAFKDLFIAKEDYLNAAFDEINKNFGSRDAFLEQECGVDAEKMQRIRANYLK